MPESESILEDLPKILNEALRVDTSSALDDDMLTRMASAFLDEPKRWHQCKQVLKQHRMLREVEPRVKQAARKIRDVPSIGGMPSSERSVSEIWKDVPKEVGNDIYVPHGYAIDNSSPAIERIEYRTTGGDTPVERRVPVCLDPLVVTRRIGHVQSKEILLEVAFRTHQGWRKAIIDRSVMASSRKIVDTAQMGLPVASDNALEVVSWVRHYEQSNRDRIKMGYASNSMGWQGDESSPARHGFMCGTQQYGANGRDIELEGSEGDMSEARDLRPRGSFENWKRSVGRLIHFPAVKVALCAAVASVLIAPVEGPNGVVEWAGRTSTGKSTVLRIAQSCWRSAATQMATWNSTIIGVEAVARFFCDLPLIIDDTSAAVEGGRSQSIGKVVYQLVSGRARGRAARDGSQKVRGRWRTLVMATGETPIGDLARAEGASARVLTFWSAPMGKSNPETGSLITETMHELADNSGHAGPMLVKWLCDNREEWDKIKAHYVGVTRLMREQICSPAASRLAEIVALLEVAAWVGYRAGCFPWFKNGLLADERVMDSVRGAVNLATVSSDRAYDAWEHLMGEVQSRPNSWFFWDELKKPERDPPGGWLGVLNMPQKEVGWFPQQLRKVLQAGDFNPDSALRAWKDLGILVKPERSRFTSQCRPYGDRRKVRLIRVKMSYPGHETEDDDGDS